MFFMMGITQGRKELEHDQRIICGHCGAYGRYRVFMTYMCLSLFFIPVFKWDRHYYVQASCCDSLYELDPQVGKSIAGGYDVEILPEHLYMVQEGRGSYKRCYSCGYSTTEDFEFCPKCGQKLR